MTPPKEKQSVHKPETGGFTSDFAVTEKINLVQEFKRVTDLIEKVNQTMMFVIIAFLIALLILAFTLAGLVIDAYRFKASSYQTLIDKVDALSQKTPLTQ